MPPRDASRRKRLEGTRSRAKAARTCRPTRMSPGVLSLSTPNHATRGKANVLTSALRVKPAYWAAQRRAM